MATDTQVLDPQVDTEGATFYAIIENKGSSEEVHISGGQKQVIEGHVMMAPTVSVRFHMGILHLRADQAAEIATMRKLCAKPGSHYTEDVETYLKAVEDPKRCIARLAAKSAQAMQANDELTQENSRLKAMLQKQSK